MQKAANMNTCFKVGIPGSTTACVIGALPTKYVWLSSPITDLDLIKDLM